MKYLRRFDSIQELNTAIQRTGISFIGLAYNNGIPVVKNKEVPPPDPTIPFYVENITNSDETLTISSSSQDSGIAVEYSTDKTNWVSLGTTGSETLTKTLQPNDKVYLRATADTWMSSSILGVSKVGGNIMSLLYGSSFTGNETTFPNDLATFVFDSLFYNEVDEENPDLINASELILPATTLVSWCYEYMFAGCTSLTTTPELPATTMMPECYRSMFNGCTSLTTAPALPATTLADSCYRSMFNGCTSLTTAPALPATTLANSCYSYMFTNCTSLTTAPALPATTLPTSCYELMFQGCTNLNYIKCLATTHVSGDSTFRWVFGVASTGTFVKNPSISESSWDTGANGIPSGWTVEDAS